MLDSELKEYLLRTRARGAICVCAHTYKKKTRAGIGSCSSLGSRVVLLLPASCKGGEGQMCLFYSASLKSTA